MRGSDAIDRTPIAGAGPRRHSSRGGRGHLLPDGALMIAQRPRWVGNANCRLSGSASERRGGTRHSPLTCRRLPLSTASDALNVELPWLSIRLPSESRAYESAYMNGCRRNRTNKVQPPAMQMLHGLTVGQQRSPLHSACCTSLTKAAKKSSSIAGRSSKLTCPQPGSTARLGAAAPRRAAILHGGWAGQGGSKCAQ